MEVQKASIAPSIAIPKQHFEINSVPETKDLTTPPPAQENTQNQSNNGINALGGLLDVQA